MWPQNSREYKMSRTESREQSREQSSEGAVLSSKKAKCWSKKGIKCVCVYK